MAEREVELLHRLARQYGVETVYYDITGRRREAGPHALLAVLRSLGAPVEGLGDVPGALRERRQEQWRRCCEPVVVAWDGEPAALKLKLPAEEAGASAGCCLELENGEERQWKADLAPLPVLQEAAVEGRNYVVKQLALPADLSAQLPPGYHKFTLALPACSCETLVISAPRRVYTLAPEAGRVWGVFIPLYALHSERSWGAGDFTNLEILARWVQELGGGMVGTLPLLAAFLDEPFEPSPYAPASRLFWNEFYLDVARVPELEQSREAQDLLRSPGFQQEIEALRAAPTVDYRRGMAVKRSILEHLARCLFAGRSERQAELQRWAAAHPAVQDYARFRAAVERQRAGWPAWPQRMRDGTLQEGDYDPDAEHYHLYVQWLAHEQLQAAAARARQQGAGLYLDLPLGVHGAGYDVWRARASFALDASSGAPPDMFLPEGQDWGLLPLHPERIREQGYRYLRACLHHHFQYAGILRLDHVMQLHRLFWVPRGLAPKEGVYVRYRAEEFYAVLALESQRCKALVVGEDLGTVPDYVREDLARHEVYRMYVLPFELQEPPGGGVPKSVPRPVPAGVMAYLNTHDMVPFAAFWQQKDEGEREALAAFLHRKGWLEGPAGDARAVLKACHAYLAASPARLCLVNLEDLWLEEAPQNAPNIAGYPNWRRKTRCTLEEFTQMPEVRGMLQEIDALRRKG